jgi:hypothetical protein
MYFRVIAVATIIIANLLVVRTARADLKSDIELARERLERVAAARLPPDPAQIYTEQKDVDLKRESLKLQGQRLKRAQAASEAFLRDLEPAVAGADKLKCDDEAARRGWPRQFSEVPADDAVWSLSPLEQVPEFSDFYARHDQKSCEGFAAWAKAGALAFLERQKTRLDSWKRDAAELQELHKKLTDSYGAWEVNLNKALEVARQTQSAPNEIAANLFKYLVVLLAFCVLIILTLRTYHSDQQMEWIKSGQIIQAMTIIVLTFSILALGLSSHMSNEVLGTLLGAIAGYVLSQGIRSAAARERTKGDNTNTATEPSLSTP